MSGDSDLSRLLRDHLDAPEHAPDFEDRLWRTIDERHGRQHGEAAGTAAVGDERGSVRLESPDTAQPRRPRNLRRVAILAAAALLAVGTAIGAIMFLPARSVPSGGSALGPADASAATVAAWMATGLGSIHSLQGQVVEHSYHSYAGHGSASDWRINFTLDASGDFRSDAVTSDARGWQGAMRQLAVYDANDEEFREIVWQVDNGNKVSEVDLQNVDPTLSSIGYIGTLASGLLQAEFTPDELLDYAAGVRSALSDSYPPIRPHPITYLGRPAWRVVTHTGGTMSPLRGSMFSQTTVAVVDRATGLLLDYRSSERNRMSDRFPMAHQTFELRMTALQVNPPLGPNTFRLDLPAVQPGTGGAQNGRVGRVVLVLPDRRAASLQAVAGALGLAPLLPNALPSGFRLASIDLDSPLLTGQAMQTFSSGRLVRTARWPLGAPDEAIFIYNHGLQRAVVRLVLLRRLGRTFQPFAPSVGLPSGGKRVRLTAGVLAGRQVVINFDFLGIGEATLFARGAGFSLTIQGDLTSSELVAAANSLGRETK